MAQPLVIAYRLIWTGYGWWLPNDPRGSLSSSINCDVFKDLGELHYGRKRVQPASREVREFYQQATPLLHNPLLKFDLPARQIIAEAFAEVIETERYTCYACALMPDHVHMLIRKHKHTAEEMIKNLKDASRSKLGAASFGPNDHPIWPSGPGYNVFLDHPDDVERTIKYVENNPLPLGEPIQRWPFVKVYDRWPLYPGHSQNSPYARALRDVGRY